MEQLAIALTGVVAIFLSQQSNEKLKKYACILGLIGQPFWFLATYKAEQWGIFAMCFLYTWMWGLGFYNNWIKGK